MADTIVVGSVLWQTLLLSEVCWGRHHSCAKFAVADVIIVGSVLWQIL